MIPARNRTTALLKAARLLACLGQAGGLDAFWSTCMTTVRLPSRSAAAISATERRWSMPIVAIKSRGSQVVLRGK